MASVFAVWLKGTCVSQPRSHFCGLLVMQFLAGKVSDGIVGRERDGVGTLGRKWMVQY